MMTEDQLTVVGAGTMGHGIAQVAAASGYAVTLYDVSEELAGRGLARIAANLDEGIARGKLTAAGRAEVLGRLRASADFDAACDCDLLIEAAPEDLGVKRRIFERAGAHCPAGALLATNTSSLSVTRIAASAAGPERVVGMHFFNPPHIMKLVEVVRAEQSADRSVERAVEAVRRMGKEPIVVRDSPGFATSRLGIALGNEAMRMLEAGVASAEDIDKAMKLGYRHPMGPLELSDLVGLDVRLAIGEHLHRELGQEQFRPPEILRRLVASGKLGRKSGEGFYRY